MSLNVGTLSAKFGLNSQEFIEKLRGVSGATELFSSQMKREMRETSQEGTESLRLLDHALGIQLPRSMSRLLTKEFPAFASGLQSILGVGAVGVLAEAAFEFGDKIAKNIEKAKKAEQEFDDALRHTKEVIGDLGASHARTMKEIELRTAELARKPGAKEASVDFKIDTAALEQAKKQIGEVSEAMEKEAKAATNAEKWTTQFWLSAGYVIDNFFSGSSRQAEVADARFKDFRLTLDEIMQAHAGDPLQGLRDSLKKADTELSTTGAEIARKLAVLQAAEAFGNLPGHAGAQAKAQLTAGIDPEALATEQRYFEDVKRNVQALSQAIEEAMGKRGNEKSDVALRRAEQIRAEVEAVRRLADTSTSAASATELLATATGKNTASGIRSAAQAEAQKKILDLIAEAESKLVNGTNEKIAKTKEFHAALAAAIPTIQAAALAEQTFKAFAEYNSSIAEFNIHLKERVAALDEEAAGHGKVAAEQAKELAGLIPLEQKLAELKALDSGHATAPAIGPLTASQAGIASAGAGLDSARQGVGLLNARIQTTAFREELHKLTDEMKVLAGSGVSPWAEIDAKILKLTGDLKLDESQVLAIRNALLSLQEIKIASEFEKLGTKLREVAASNAAITAGSPFAKIDADVVKFTRELGLNAQQIATLRQGLIALQSGENTGKAWLNVDQLNASGAKMTELRQQMEGLRAAASSGRVQTDDGGSVALSRDALAAVHQEMLAIAEEQNKIALKTGDIDAGILAWATDLQKVQSAGEVTLEALTQATKGFEENAAKSFMMVLESQRGGQRALIHDLEKLWSDYFKNLATMGMKQGMEHLLAPIGKAITGGMGKGAGAGGTASLSAAGTMLTHAGTELLSAAMALRASAGMGGGASAGAGGGSPFGDITALGGAIPFFASGGDTTPGSSFISGESGAERVDLNGRGGAHITPLESGTPSGDVHHYYDMRGSVVTEDLMRRSEAASAIRASESRMLSAMPAMQREISLRKRS